MFDIAALTKLFNQMVATSNEMCARVGRIVQILESRNDVARFPFFIEEIATTTKEFDLEAENQGVAPAFGHYENLGLEPFKVILENRGGKTREHTVAPESRNIINSPITKITVIPVNNQPAYIQIRGQ